MVDTDASRCRSHQLVSSQEVMQRGVDKRNFIPTSKKCSSLTRGIQTSGCADSWSYSQPVPAFICPMPMKSGPGWSSLLTAVTLEEETEERLVRVVPTLASLSSTASSRSARRTVSLWSRAGSRQRPCQRRRSKYDNASSSEQGEFADEILRVVVHAKRLGRAPGTVDAAASGYCVDNSLLAIESVVGTRRQQLARLIVRSGAHQRGTVADHGGSSS